jgi:transketolase
MNRFVLSKSHACPALYSAAAEYGIVDHADLSSFRNLSSLLQGHPHVLATPWVETSTGSLGQGFSVAIGMAIGLHYQSIAGRVYVILGDGELQEGEVWEGAMCAIIDYNKMQSDNLNENIMGLEPLADKWRAFKHSVLNNTA